MGVVYHPNDATHHPGITDSNMTDAFARICEIEEFGKQVKYFVHGTELCPTTGTEHLQCFFVFKNDQSLANLRSKFSKWFGFNQTIAWKKADSNADECIDYCKKDGLNIVEFGQRPKGKGARSDLESVAKSIKSGANMSDLFELHPASFFKYAPGMQKAISLTSKPRDWKTEVYWIHGPTGTGKSNWVFRTCDRAELYVKDGNSKWFDGYQSQKNVLFDDFRPSKELPFNLLLRLLDRYPMTVEGKGSSMNFSPERIFITTPQPPVETFQHLEWIKEEDLSQLTRRITQVIHFPDLNTITRYSLLPPYVMQMNDWGQSVPQNTRGPLIIAKPVAVRTQRRRSSQEQTQVDGLLTIQDQPAVQPVINRDYTVQPVWWDETVVNSESETDSSVDMASMSEISGDSEPVDGDSIHSSPRSSDSEPESDNSFVVKESVEEEMQALSSARKKAKKRSVMSANKSAKKPTKKKKNKPAKKATQLATRARPKPFILSSYETSESDSE
jgi:hypothetical protein